MQTDTATQWLFPDLAPLARCASLDNAACKRPRRGRPRLRPICSQPAGGQPGHCMIMGRSIEAAQAGQQNKRRRCAAPA